MSEEDQSDQNKGFLARWSQRKQEAKPDRGAPAAETDVPAAPVAEGDAAQEFDPSSLPKIEDMTATTDITGFLRKGVPEHLRNTALRKSWALDPAIRNYVNPALEYAYDWNTPGGVPGSSELGAGMDVAGLVLQIMGGSESAAEARVASADPGKAPAIDAAQSPAGGAPQEPGPDLPTQASRLTVEAVSAAQTLANANERARVEAEPAEDSERSNPVAPQQTVRRHGSAKPLV
jgi:hypothetical protein